MKNRHICHFISAFGKLKSVLQKQSVLLRAEVTSHLCTKCEKHKFDNDLTALVLIFWELQNTPEQGNIYVLFETFVINRYVYHLLSACGTTKSVLQKQRKIEFSAILSIFIS